MACSIRRSADGTIEVTKDVELFESLVNDTGSQTTALNMWAFAQTDDFENSGAAKTVEGVRKMMDSMKASQSELTPSQLYEVKAFMRDNGFTNSTDLYQEMVKVFKPNGIFDVNPNRMVSSGLWQESDITSFDEDGVRELLDNLEGTAEFEVEVNEEASYKDSSVKTVFGTEGSISESDIYQELISAVEDFQDVDAIKEAVNQLGYIDFTDKYNKDKSFSDRLNNSLSKLKRVPMLHIQGDTITDDNLSTEKTVRATILAGVDTLSLEADTETLSEITPDLWQENTTLIKDILKEVEVDLADMNLDVVGISEAVDNRDAVIDLLLSAQDMLTKPSANNIRVFSNLKDNLLGAPSNNLVVSTEYTDLNIVHVVADKSQKELFEDFGLLKVGPNLYHKIRVEEDTVSSAYDILYQRFEEGRLELPSQFKVAKNGDKTGVLADLTKFVNSRDIGFETDMREVASLMQLVFDHKPLPNNTIKEVENLSLIQTDVEYLKTDFISDFYKYYLKEKVKGSALYKEALSKFSFNDTDISLMEDVNISNRNMEYSQEILDYVRLKGDIGAEVFNTDTNIKAFVDEDFLALNNPQSISEYQGEVVKEGDYVVIPSSQKLYVKVGGELFRQSLKGENADLYLKVGVNEKGVYKAVSENFEFNVEEAQSVLDAYDADFKQRMTREQFKERLKKAGSDGVVRGVPRFMFVGERGMNKLPDTAEASIRLDNLQVARDMETAGKTKKEILSLTGWQRGADSKWRYEVEDPNLKIDSITPDKEYRLSDVFEKSELTDLYEETRVLFTYSEIEGGDGQASTEFDRQGARITINLGSFVKKGVYRGGRVRIQDLWGGDTGLVRAALLHETMHAIQKAEGFEGGGSPLTTLRGLFIELGLSERSTARDAIKALESSDMANTRAGRLLNQYLLAQNDTQRDLISFELYTLVAGEVEARNVVNRSEMPLEERRKLLMEETQDVATKDQIFITSNLNLQVIGEKAILNEQEQNNLAEAKQLDSQGVDSLVIEMQTGWYKEQGKWKMFSREMLSKFNITETVAPVSGETYLLEELINNPELFRAYPDIAKTKIKFDDKPSERNDGLFILGLQRGGEIVLNSLESDFGPGIRAEEVNQYPQVLLNQLFRLRESGREMGQLSDSELNTARRRVWQSTLAHEVQHLVQVKEGFPTGGTPSIFRSLAETVLRGLRGIPLGRVKQYYEENKGLVSEKDRPVVEVYIDAVDEAVKNQDLGAIERRLSDKYRLLMGEVEARTLEYALGSGEVNSDTPFSVLRGRLLKLEGLDGQNLIPYTTNQEVTSAVIDKLKQTGLATDVVQMSTQEIKAKLKEIGFDDNVVQQVIAWHGTINPNKVIEQVTTKNQEVYGELMGGTYFGSKETAAFFSGWVPGLSKMFEVEIEDSSFEVVDMKGQQPGVDTDMVNFLGQERYNELLEKKRLGIIKGLTLENAKEPGVDAVQTQWVVFDGEVLNKVNEFKEDEAFDLIGDLLYKRPVNFQFVGEQNQLTPEDVSQLEEAKGLDAQGVDKQDIYIATKWFKGAEGKWLREVEDFTINSSNESAINSLLEEGVFRSDIKSLSDKYSEGLTRKPVNITIELNEESDRFTTQGDAGATSTSNEIRVEISIPKDLNTEGKRKLLQEAFMGWHARGLNRNDEKGGVRSVEDVINHELTHILQEEGGRFVGNDPKEVFNMYVRRHLKDFKSKNYNEELSKLYGVDNFYRDIAYPMYENSVGEVEARLVEERFGKRTSIPTFGDPLMVDITTVGEMFRQVGVTLTPQGFVHNKVVYLNTEAVDPINTSVHEFGHLYLDALKENFTDKYNAGLSLVDKFKNSEAKEYVEYVKSTQPNLKEGTEAFKNEVLAQVIGDNGAKLVNSKKKGSIKEWLSDLWNSIKELVGLSSMTAEQVANMSLQEFAEAVSVDLLGGSYEAPQATNLELLDKYRSQDMDGIAAIIDNKIEFLFETNEDVLNEIDCQG